MATDNQLTTLFGVSIKFHSLDNQLTSLFAVSIKFHSLETFDTPLPHIFPLKHPILHSFELLHTWKIPMSFVMHFYPSKFYRVLLLTKSKFCLAIYTHPMLLYLLDMCYLLYDSEVKLDIPQPLFELDQHRSKSQALSSAERDQIFQNANLFLSIAVKEVALVSPIYSHLFDSNQKTHIFI